MASAPSTKQIQIDKTKTRMIAIIALASVVTIFSLFAVNALFNQGQYQRRVLSEKNKAIKELEKNVKEANELITQYQVFAEQTTSLIGADNTSVSDDIAEDNPRIVLDALPSKYDFPAWATSLEKILSGRGVGIKSISGKDEGSANPDAATTSPAPVEISFGIEGQTGYQNSQLLLKDFERSIRPVDIRMLELSGSDVALKVLVNGVTYYQAPVSLDVTSTKVVK